MAEQTSGFGNRFAKSGRPGKGFLESLIDFYELTSELT